MLYRCCRCAQQLPRSNFYGISHINYCKSCVKKHNRVWREQHEKDKEQFNKFYSPKQFIYWWHATCIHAVKIGRTHRRVPDRVKEHARMYNLKFSQWCSMSVLDNQATYLEQLICDRLKQKYLNVPRSAELFLLGEDTFEDAHRLIVGEISAAPKN